MCGICGGINAEKNAVIGLLLAMMDRGKQSTGLAIIDVNDDSALVFKDTVDAFKFTDQEGDAIQKAKGSVLIGHTRFATTGGITKENAHPWDVDDTLVGAHNGIINNHDELDEKGGVDKKGRATRVSAVDSLAAFRHIARTPLEDLKKLLSDDIEGYYALEWYDRRDGMVRLAKSGAPIWVAELPWTNGTQSVYWASEWQPLAAAVATINPGFNLIEMKDGDLRVYDGVTGLLIEAKDFAPAKRYGTKHFGRGAYAQGSSYNVWDGDGAGACGTKYDNRETDDYYTTLPASTDSEFKALAVCDNGTGKVRNGKASSAGAELSRRYNLAADEYDEVEAEYMYERMIDEFGQCRYCFEPAYAKNVEVCDDCAAWHLKDGAGAGDEDSEDIAEWVAAKAANTAALKEYDAKQAPSLIAEGVKAMRKMQERAETDVSDFQDWGG